MRYLVFVLCSFATAFAQTETQPAPAPNVTAAKSRFAPPAPANPALPTLWVAGDSTAARGRGEHQQGWAVPFADYFDAAKINVVNRALGGRSSRTFITEGWWDKLLADLKAGDVVLIQFGHNDASPVNEDPSMPRNRMRSRGTIGGLGEETQEITNVLNGKHETIHTFGWYMRKMIDDVKAKGARPIVVSPTVRNKWENGKIERGPGEYRVWSSQVAKAAGVPFIDLSTMMADKFDALGEAETKKFYEQDFVHFDLAGAVMYAEAVVSGLKGFRVPVIMKSLSAKGEAVPAEKFVWLRLGEPATPAVAALGALPEDSAAKYLKPEPKW